MIGGLGDWVIGRLGGRILPAGRVFPVTLRVFSVTLRMSPVTLSLSKGLPAHPTCERGVPYISTLSIKIKTKGADYEY